MPVIGDFSSTFGSVGLMGAIAPGACFTSAGVVAGDFPEILDEPELRFLPNISALNSSSLFFGTIASLPCTVTSVPAPKLPNHSPPRTSFDPDENLGFFVCSAVVASGIISPGPIDLLASVPVTVATMLPTPPNIFFDSSSNWVPALDIIPGIASHFPFNMTSGILFIASIPPFLCKKPSSFPVSVFNFTFLTPDSTGEPSSSLPAF